MEVEVLITMKEMVATRSGIAKRTEIRTMEVIMFAM